MTTDERIAKLEEKVDKLFYIFEQEVYNFHPSELIEVERKPANPVEPTDEGIEDRPKPDPEQSCLVSTKLVKKDENDPGMVEHKLIQDNKRYGDPRKRQEAKETEEQRVEEGIQWEQITKRIKQSV